MLIIFIVKQIRLYYKQSLCVFLFTGAQVRIPTRVVEKKEKEKIH